MHTKFEEAAVAGSSPKIENARRGNVLALENMHTVEPEILEFFCLSELQERIFLNSDVAQRTRILRYGRLLPQFHDKIEFETAKCALGRGNVFPLQLKGME